LENVTRGQDGRLHVEDEPVDVRDGEVISQQRVLDLESGLVTRTAEWESPAHRTVRVRSTRLVSLRHRARAAVLYEVEPIDGEVELVIQSELVANEPVPAAARGDPRASEVIESPLTAELSATSERGAVLIHSTKRSRLRVATAMEHVVRGPRGTEVKS